MEVVEFLKQPTDAERAKDYGQRLAGLLTPVLELFNEAKANDMQINFQIGEDAIGRVVVQRVTITKTLI